MQSNEITWALYVMAIVAAPIVAVWLWRRLSKPRTWGVTTWIAGTRNALHLWDGNQMWVRETGIRDGKWYEHWRQHAAKPQEMPRSTELAGSYAEGMLKHMRESQKPTSEVAPGWYMDFDDSTVGDMRIEPAEYDKSGRRILYDPMLTDPHTEYRVRNDITGEVTIVRPKPAPYSESAKAPGSKVSESHEVWATRQLEKLGALCHENERRLDALEAKEPEAGRGGHRVWKYGLGAKYVWDGQAMYGFHDGSWASDGKTWTPEHLWCLDNYGGELHGEEADRIVAEFLEWRGK